MAFQISEHKLSHEAKEALKNTKNQSQFARDAIEYYVRRGSHASEKGSTSIESIEEKLDKILNLLGVGENKTNTTKQGFAPQSVKENKVKNESQNKKTTHLAPVKMKPDGLFHPEEIISGNMLLDEPIENEDFSKMVLESIGKFTMK